MSCRKLATLIIFVDFLNRDVSELGVLSLEVDWVIFEMLSSATPSRSSDATICKGQYMSWWQQATFFIYVEFLKLDGSDLEGLVLDVDMVFP